MNIKQFLQAYGRQIMVASIILVVGIGVMVLLAVTKKPAQKREVTQRVRAVELEEVSYHDVTLEITGNGTLESTQTLNLVNSVNGPVVFARNDLRSGIYVTAGDTLLKVDSRESANRVYQARSALINSIVSLIPDLKVNASGAIYSKWNRYLESLDVHSRTPELPTIETSLERIRVSRHNIFNQYYLVKNAEINLQRHAIVAPFDGYLVGDGLIAGTWVAPGQIIGQLVDPHHLQVSVPLSINELLQLEGDDSPLAVIQASDDPNAAITGEVTRWNTSLDRHSQLVPVHVEVTVPELNAHFLPGNYVAVRVQGRTLQNVARLPRETVTPDEHVYTYSDSTLGKAPVRVLAFQDEDAIIAAGSLDPGTRVVTTILQNPIVGMRIAPSVPEVSVADSPGVATDF